ncbi:hypothetical protein FQ087_17995 [Sporosarcina sp. ANT_H38]|uniref:hypothetical protein n=1 Tax=Sporosarcina sp. ANT_H38 TaxID=2597358 RepID=UPI0011F2B076|nr:hypothetical protein [Sporosarcina sp. ANT_H38]KAA0944019.1 hypothetical protein FQ087_17995 [Sporosarcina sp. ANT_H38]
MVRRRGTYQIKIRDKQLVCLFCQHEEFLHREVYIDLNPLDETVTDQLTLQSFSCPSCGDIQMFQEKNRFDHTLQKHVSIIEYTEVIKE